MREQQSRAATRPKPEPKKPTRSRPKREDAWAEARRTHPVPDQVEPDVIFWPLPAPARQKRSRPHV